MNKEQSQEIETLRSAVLLPVALNNKTYETILPDNVSNILHRRENKILDRLSNIKAKTVGAVSALSIAGLTFQGMVFLANTKEGVNPAEFIASIAFCSITGLMSFMAGKSASIYFSNKKQIKAIQPDYEKILDQNFEAFKEWLKARYNIVPRSRSLYFKELVAGVKTNHNFWFQATDDNKYFLKIDKANNGFYLTQDTSETAIEKIVEVSNNPKVVKEIIAEQNPKLFVDDLKTLWDTLQQRINIIKQYEHLSVESSHAMNRVEQDCDNLINNIHKLIQLDVEPDRQKMEIVLSGLNREMQQIIASEASTVEHDIDSIAGWVSSRTLTATENKLVLSKTLDDEVEPVKEIILIQEEKTNQL